MGHSPSFDHGVRKKISRSAPACPGQKTRVSSSGHLEASDSDSSSGDAKPPMRESQIRKASEKVSQKDVLLRECVSKDFLSGDNAASSFGISSTLRGPGMTGSATPGSQGRDTSSFARNFHTLFADEDPFDFRYMYIHFLNSSQHDASLGIFEHSNECTQIPSKRMQHRHTHMRKLLDVPAIQTALLEV